MHFVFLVIKDSILFSSKQRDFGLISAKIGIPPLKIKALAVETNVKDGIIISSPGLISANIADISKAEVHEVVSKHGLYLMLFLNKSHFSL